MSIVTSPALTTVPMVQPFDPARFVGQIQYDGATEIKVAALAAHRSGELVLLSLVGNDTAISARIAKLFVNEKITFVPPEDLPWDGPRLLCRLACTYRRLLKKLPGVKNTMHYLIVPTHGNIGFNLQNPPDIPPDLLPKKAEAAGTETPLTVKTDQRPSYRYVFASPPRADTEAQGAGPSVGAVLGTFVGMRMIVLRSRQPAMQPIVRQWVTTLWQRGLEQGLIEPLPSAGVCAWAITNSLLRWNTLVSAGVTAGWLPVPTSTGTLIINDTRIALAAD